jgi:iron complex outermembrane recepter protein
MPRRSPVNRPGSGRCLSLAAACGFVAALASLPSHAQQTAGFAQPLKKLSLEELMNVNVSTASRVSQPLFDSPVAAYVVTRDEIRRAGVRSIPEALRLAPGVEVAREGTNSWNITIRGFNSDLSNKLLVLIDGRSVYSPLFAGVFWDAQDYLLEDIDRIEVIAGPGGTMWGANAVNGVINIITRRAGESTGGFVAGGGGNEQGFASARIAGRLPGDWQARGYLTYFDRDASRPSDGSRGIDDWDGFQAGFRTDHEAGADAFTVQGDAYGGNERALYNRDFTLGTLPGEPRVQRTEIDGQNVLGRWTRRARPGSEMSLQVYVDRTRREIPETFTERRGTLDLDFQHLLPLGSRNKLIWGGGLRYTEDSIRNSQFASFLPPSRSDYTFSAFLQDEFALVPQRAFLTAGTKVEHNDYSGFEVQPNLRLAGLVSERQTLWASVSRAVRIPSRLDADLQLTAPVSVPGLPVPLYVRVDGSEDFDSEEVWAYEAGWRMRLAGSLTLDLAAFHNEYEDLQTQEPLPLFVVPGPPTYLMFPNVLRNGKDARSDGATLAATWQPAESWRLQFSYTYVELEMQPHPDSNDQGARTVEGNSPKHQAALHAYVDLARDVSLYGGLRYVDELPSQGVPDYLSLDASVIWSVDERLELSLTGRDLLDPLHPEFGVGAPNQIERNWYARLAWRF